VKRWILTGLSFAGVLGVSIYMVARWSQGGLLLTLPLRAHLLAILAVGIEIATRSWKITLSGKAMRIRLPFMTALRTTLAGDFGGAITPARSGAEPARYLVLAEAGVPAPKALMILYAELFVEMLSLAAVVIVVAVVFRHAGAVIGALVGVVGGYAAFVLGVALIAVVLAKREVKDSPPAWARHLGIRGHRWQVIEHWFEQVRTTVDAIRNVNVGWAALSFLASVVHVAMRLCVLPALVLTSAPAVPGAPLALWPLGFLYGVAVVPAPGGGGAMELAFRAALGDVIPPALFAPALLWWRFYTFYIYIILGALVAGGVAMRAVRKTHEMEDELGKA
jgi:uncharacterized protein (TIRG00374 family)